MRTHQVLAGLACLMLGIPEPVLATVSSMHSVAPSNGYHRGTGPRILVASDQRLDPVLPVRSRSNDSKPAKRQTFDITLTETGGIEGRILWTSGEVAANVPIVFQNVLQRTRIPTSGNKVVTSDAGGNFSASSLQGGVYVVTVAGRTHVLRAWRAGTAPPAAQNHMVLILDDTVRGQSPVGAFFRSDRFLFASAMIVAIGIPIAVYANRHDGYPGS